MNLVLIYDSSHQIVNLCMVHLPVTLPLELIVDTVSHGSKLACKLRFIEIDEPTLEINASRKPLFIDLYKEHGIDIPLERVPQVDEPRESAILLSVFFDRMVCMTN